MWRSMYSWSRKWLEVSGGFRTQAALPPEQSPWCPLNSRHCWPENRSGRHGEEKNLNLSGTKETCSLSLYQLLYPGFPGDNIYCQNLLYKVAKSRQLRPCVLMLAWKARRRMKWSLKWDDQNVKDSKRERRSRAIRTGIEYENTSTWGSKSISCT
jgi:hypothetical protein